MSIAADLKRARVLADPVSLAAALGLGLEARDRRRQAGGGITVRCPRHGGVSCSVTRGGDGTTRVHCFGCDFTGDALTLIAEVRGMSLHRDFPAVLADAARIAGAWHVLDELEGRREHSPIKAHRRASVTTDGLAREPTLTYPPATSIAAVWQTCLATSDDAEVSAMLMRRGLDPEAVDDAGLARALPPHASVPRWAHYRGTRSNAEPWTSTGHRLILPVYDAGGRMCSVRAWCVRETADPKRLPPVGYRASGLVLADGGGAALLRAGRLPAGLPERLRLVIVEGEPDYVSWATRFSDANADAPIVLGIVSGAWSCDLAARIPDGTRVIIRTHGDAAGERYASEIVRSLAERCELLRPRSA